MSPKKSIPVTKVFTYTNDRRKAVYSVILAIISVFGGLIPYFSAARLVILVITHSLTPLATIYWGGCAITGYFCKTICYTLSSSCSHQMAYQTIAEIRIMLTDKLLLLSLGKAAEKTTGEYKNIIMDEMEHLEYPLAHMLPELTSNILGFIIIIGSLLIISWPLALASLGTLILGFLVYGLMMFGKNVMGMYQKYTKDNEMMSSAMVEYVSGMEVIKAFGKTVSSMNIFSKAITTFRDSMKNWFAHCYPYLAGFYVITPNSLFFVLPIGMLLMSHNLITINQFILCMFLSFGVSEPIIKIMEFADHIMAITTTLKKVDELMETDKLSQGTLSFSDTDLITVNNLTFGYEPQNKVLKNISFSVKKGQKIAFVGSSGSGKSTIAKLLVRFYDPDSGSIKINNTDIRTVPLKLLMDNISFVTQDNFLFNTTIYENIRIGNPSASQSEIIKAAKKAACHDFIEDFTDGYNTLVGEAGDKLSGGQKQRIAIARTMLKNAPIVILDEASAFIDPENEEKIQQSIQHLTEDKTLIMIAHRLSTIINCDCIYVIDKGHIVNNGTHEELLKKCTVYQKLWIYNQGQEV
jgi:ATP-binding cassette subfamily B protein IrtA